MKIFLQLNCLEEEIIIIEDENNVLNKLKISGHKNIARLQGAALEIMINNFIYGKLLLSKQEFILIGFFAMSMRVN